MEQTAKVEFPVEEANESFGYYIRGRIWKAWVYEGELSPKEVNQLVAKLDKNRNESITSFSTTCEALNFLRSLGHSKK